MDSSCHSELYYPTYKGLGPQQPHPTGFSFEPHRSSNQYLLSFASHHAPADHPPGVLSTQYITPYNPLGILPARDNWHQLPVEHDPFISDRAGLIGPSSVQQQYVYLTYAEKAVQTIQLDPASEGNMVQGRPQIYQRPTPGKLVPQETYKPPRRQAEFSGSDAIVFIIDGKEGIRLSDASEGNWEGFEGGEDRSLFDGNRLQVMIRLHLVGCSPWNSKIATTDFTAKRQPITRRKLAAEVAKSVKKFIAREKLNGHDGGHPRCNWGDVSLENVFLTRMVHVSPASWQPEIFVERPSVALHAAASPSASSPSLFV
ncbi:hypothetical protein BDM02DRAFT_3112728 [Thelephora ganbajun]|uniref:Uncharacterized protein n=1 Tax=Thelephora ganbajun TaxID=370292 RepID=A0ACB6ZKN2_THEGA|nr:hypothetical protein BDM02DRAFT_3112728 [Thelephora ganbajun]